MTLSASQSPFTGDTDTEVSAIITGLTTGTTYHFRISGNNSLGTATGSEMAFTTSYVNPITIVWSKCFGKSTNEYYSSNVQTPDNNYLVAGYVEGESGDYGAYDGWIFKFNNERMIEWQKTYGGNLSNYIGYVSKTSEGGFRATGSSSSGSCDICNSDCRVIKLIQSGDLNGKNSTEVIHMSTEHR